MAFWIQRRTMVASYAHVLDSLCDISFPERRVFVCMPLHVSAWVLFPRFILDRLVGFVSRRFLVLPINQDDSTRPDIDFLRRGSMHCLHACMETIRRQLARSTEQNHNNREYTCVGTNEFGASVPRTEKFHPPHYDSLKMIEVDHFHIFKVR